MIIAGRRCGLLLLLLKKIVYFSKFQAFFQLGRQVAVNKKGSLIPPRRQYSRCVGREDINTAAAPASEVEAVVGSPTNMAAAKIATVDFIKMTSK